MIDAFHDDRHHMVKFQAFAAKDLLMDDAVPSSKASSTPSSNSFFLRH